MRSCAALLFVLVACTPKHPSEPQLAGHELGTSTAPGPRMPVEVQVDAGNAIVASGPLSGAATRSLANGPAPAATAPAPAATAPAPAAAAPAPAAPPAPDAQPNVTSPPPANPD